MSEQDSATHSPREDDALKREVRSELQAKRATRAEEWLEPEPPGEDEPEATWAPAGRPGGAEECRDPDPRGEEEPEATWAPAGRPGGTPPGQDWETIELRSALAAHL